MKNQKDYKNHKGFTLVELIVVIVILAILAAILIPGLLKWIDEAKKKQYELEARNIYLATEASLVELHTWGFAGTGSNTVPAGTPWDLNKLSNGMFTVSQNNKAWFDYIKEMSGTNSISYLRCYIDNGKLKALAIEYKSSDGKTIRATIKEKNVGDPSNMPSGWTWSDDGTWNIEVQPQP